MTSPWNGFKRWRLRPGVEEAALVALVREEIVPHYRALDPAAVLGLLRTDTPGEYLATQLWPSGEYRAEVCSGERYAQWFSDYKPILERFDALIEFVDETDSNEMASGAGGPADLVATRWTGVELLDAGDHRR